MNKLYIVTREDLPEGAQAAQSCHASLAFAFEHPELCADWHARSNNIVLLAVGDEVELELLGQRARSIGLACSSFCEPDFDDQLTSIAFMGGGAEKLTSNLPLALRARKEAA